MAPGRDAVHAVAILRDHRVADVRELAVLEDQEVCGPRAISVPRFCIAKPQNTVLDQTNLGSTLVAPVKRHLYCLQSKVNITTWCVLIPTCGGLRLFVMMYWCTACGPCFSASACSWWTMASSHRSKMSTCVFNTQMDGPTCTQRGTVKAQPAAEPEVVPCA